MTDARNVSILVVDDEPAITMILTRWLGSRGYACTSADSAQAALETLGRECVDLVVSDIRMPGASGIELLGTIRDRFPDVAVIMSTAVDDNETAVRALELGAYGYVIKPLERNEVLINVANALERRRLVRKSREYEEQLESEVARRTAEVRDREAEIVFRLMSASEYRDDETGSHIRRMGLYARSIAEAAGWSADDLGTIELAAPMHDVGKIGIPDSILRKPGKLDPGEFEVIKTHTEIGARILQDSATPLLQLAQDIALSHHEKWDGTGYPNGLRGNEIPESARICALADVYDALVSRRVYRPALPEQEALDIMLAGKGKHFDPDLFEFFLQVLPEIRRIRAKVTEAGDDLPVAEVNTAPEAFLAVMEGTDQLMRTNGRLVAAVRQE